MLCHVNNKMHKKLSKRCVHIILFCDALFSLLLCSSFNIIMKLLLKIQHKQKVNNELFPPWQHQGQQGCSSVSVHFLRYGERSVLYGMYKENFYVYSIVLRAMGALGGV